MQTRHRSGISTDHRRRNYRRSSQQTVTVHSKILDPAYKVLRLTGGEAFDVLDRRLDDTGYRAFGVVCVVRRNNHVRKPQQHMIGHERPEVVFIF